MGEKKRNIELDLNSKIFPPLKLCHFSQFIEMLWALIDNENKKTVLQLNVLNIVLGAVMSTFRLW